MRQSRLLKVWFIQVWEVEGWALRLTAALKAGKWKNEVLKPDHKHVTPDRAQLSHWEKTEGRGRRTRGYELFTVPDWPIKKQNDIPLKLERSQAVVSTSTVQHSCRNTPDRHPTRLSEIFKMHGLTRCQLTELRRGRSEFMLRAFSTALLLPVEKHLCYFCSQKITCCVLTISANHANNDHSWRCRFLLLKYRMDLPVAKNEPETAGPQSLKPLQHGPRSVEREMRPKGSRKAKSSKISSQANTVSLGWIQ